MKNMPAVVLTIAAAAFTLPITQFAHAQAAPSNDTSSAAMQIAMNMVPAEANLTQTLDAGKVKLGDTVEAQLAYKIRLKNGHELPGGTVLIGQISADEVQQDGMSRLALVFTKATLKNGEEIPIKATIVRVFPPNSSWGIYSAFGDPMINNWNDRTLRVDQADALEGVDHHSRIDSSNSGDFIPNSSWGIYPAFGDSMINNWNDRTSRVDQADALEGVWLHSRIDDSNSGEFVSKQQDEIRISTEYVLALAIAEQMNS